MRLNEILREYNLKFNVVKKYLRDTYNIQAWYTMNLNDQLSAEILSYFNPTRKYVYDNNGRKRYVDFTPLKVWIRKNSQQNNDRTLIAGNVEKESFYYEFSKKEKLFPAGGQPGFKRKRNRRP